MPCRSVSFHLHREESWWCAVVHYWLCVELPPYLVSAKRQNEGKKINKSETFIWREKSYIFYQINSVLKYTSKITETMYGYLCFGRQSFNLLDQESVRFDHDHQRDACGLLNTADQAWVVHDLRPLAQSRGHLTATSVRSKSGESRMRQCITFVSLAGGVETNAEQLPFDVDGEEPLHISGAAAYSCSKGLSLAVAEEKHLQHV